MTKTMTTLAIVALSGSAMAQSGLDIDRAYAAELRADADTRSSLLGSTGPGIEMDIFTQFRYTYNSRDAVSGGDFGDSDTTVGFSAPRTQIRLSGGVEGTDISGHVSFDFGGAFDKGFSAGSGASGDGEATLRSAYAKWSIDDNWTFLFGQMKNPFSFEANVAPEFSQGVERSIVKGFFDVGYTQGIALNYTDDTFRFTGVISDGPAIYLGGTNAANSFYNSAGESDISLTGRVDVLFEGSWDQFSDFASWQGSNDAIRVGGAIHWSTRGDTNPAAVTSSIWGGVANFPAGGSIDTEDVFAWTVDASYESDGWGIFAAYTSLNLDADFLTAGGADGGSNDLTNDGFVLQGNVFLSEQAELFARYSVIFLDDDANLGLISATSEDSYSTIVAGMNYYLVPESHAARFSVDVAWAVEDSSGIDSFGFSDYQTTGFLGAGGSGTAADEEIMIRAQMSLLF